MKKMNRYRPTTEGSPLDTLPQKKSRLHSLLQVAERLFRTIVSLEAMRSLPKKRHSETLLEPLPEMKLRKRILIATVILISTIFLYLVVSSPGATVKKTVRFSQPP